MGYLHDGRLVTLGESLFGENVQLQDIYLTSKLMKDGKIKANGAGFGSRPEDLYLASLANTQLLWNAHSQHESITFDMGYYFMPSKELLKQFAPEFVFFGVSFSSKRIVHRLDLDIQSGKIATDGASFVPASGESSVKQFFSDANIDFTDFFRRYVLAPKKIRYDQIMEHLGVGDTVLTALVDWGGMRDWIKTAQCAILLSIPTGKRDDTNALWPLHAGSGHVECTFLGALNISTPLLLFNPFGQCSFTCHAPYVEARRISQRVTRQTFDKKEYLAGRFQLFKIDEFDELDSQSPAFANETKEVTIYEGLSGHLMLGNMIKLNKGKVQCGLYYDFFFKNAAKFDRKTEKSSYSDSSEPKKSLLHSIHYQMTYAPFKKLSFMLELSQAIAGRNMEREFFASVSLLSIF